MERRPEKLAGELQPFCGVIALIFLGFLLLFCQEKSKYKKTSFINFFLDEKVPKNQVQTITTLPL